MVQRVPLHRRERCAPKRRRTYSRKCQTLTATPAEPGVLPGAIAVRAEVLKEYGETRTNMRNAYLFGELEWKYGGRYVSYFDEGFNQLQQDTLRDNIPPRFFRKRSAL